MIPKIIHYCWVGRNPLPEDVCKYIESWKKYCPDYQIIEWNEDNFDIKSNQYACEAYNAKKWAFVSDYLRLSVLYDYGGIYLDTDVEVLKNMDVFLKHNAFSGFESEELIPTGIMGAEKGNPWIKHLLSYYDKKSFYLDDGSFNLTPNTITITDMTQKLSKRFKLNNSYQELDCGVSLYPKEFFCPKDCLSGIVHITKNTYCIHHFAGSWLTDADKKGLDYRNSLLKNHKLLSQLYQSKVGYTLLKLPVDALVIYKTNGMNCLVNKTLLKLGLRK